MKTIKRLRPPGVPKDYIKQISFLLIKRDLPLKPQKIRDVLRGKYKDEALTKIVVKTMEKVKRKHARSMKKIAHLQRRAKTR